MNQGRRVASYVSTGLKEDGTVQMARGRMKDVNAGLHRGKPNLRKVAYAIACNLHIYV